MKVSILIALWHLESLSRERTAGRTKENRPLEIVDQLKKSSLVEALITCLNQVLAHAQDQELSYELIDVCSDQAEPKNIEDGWFHIKTSADPLSTAKIIQDKLSLAKVGDESDCIRQLLHLVSKKSQDPISMMIVLSNGVPSAEFESIATLTSSKITLPKHSHVMRLWLQYDDMKITGDQAKLIQSIGFRRIATAKLDKEFGKALYHKCFGRKTNSAPSSSTKISLAVSAKRSPVRVTNKENLDETLAVASATKEDKIGSSVAARACMSNYMRFLYSNEPPQKYIQSWTNMKRRLRSKLGSAYVVNLFQHGFTHLVMKTRQIRYAWQIELSSLCGLEPDSMSKTLLRPHDDFVPREGEEKKFKIWYQSLQLDICHLESGKNEFLRKWLRLMLTRELQMQVILILELLRSLNSIEPESRELIRKEIDKKGQEQKLKEILEDLVDYLCIQFSCPLDLDDPPILSNSLRVLSGQLSFMENQFLVHVVRNVRYSKSLPAVTEMLNHKFDVPFFSPVKPDRSTSIAHSSRNEVANSVRTNVSQASSSLLELHLGKVESTNSKKSITSLAPNKPLFIAHVKQTKDALGSKRGRTDDKPTVATKRRQNDLTKAFEDACKQPEESQPIKASTFYGKTKKKKCATLSTLGPSCQQKKSKMPLSSHASTVTPTKNSISKFGKFEDLLTEDVLVLDTPVRSISKVKL